MDGIVVLLKNLGPLAIMVAIMVISSRRKGNVDLHDEIEDSERPLGTPPASFPRLEPPEAPRPAARGASAPAVPLPIEMNEARRGSERPARRQPARTDAERRAFERADQRADRQEQVNTAHRERRIRDDAVAYRESLERAARDNLKSPEPTTPRRRKKRSVVASDAPDAPPPPLPALDLGFTPSERELISNGPSASERLGFLMDRGGVSALRRAMLAQEILGLPVALRPATEPR